MEGHGHALSEEAVQDHSFPPLCTVPNVDTVFAGGGEEAAVGTPGYPRNRPGMGKLLPMIRALDIVNAHGRLKRRHGRQSAAVWMKTDEVSSRLVRGANAPAAAGNHVIHGDRAVRVAYGHLPASRVEVHCRGVFD